MAGYFSSLLSHKELGTRQNIWKKILFWLQAPSIHAEISEKEQMKEMNVTGTLTLSAGSFKISEPVILLNLRDKEE